MKERLRNIALDFTRVALALATVLPVIRILEFLQLNTVHQLPAGSWMYVFTGLLPDLCILLTFFFLAAIPYFLIAWLSRRAASLLTTILVTVWFLLHYALVKYFVITLVPLDQVIFSYTFDEMLTIASSSAEFSIATYVPFLVIIAAVLLSRILYRKLDPARPVMIAVMVFVLVSPAGLKYLEPKPGKYDNDLSYYMVVNKPWYFIRKCLRYYRSGDLSRNERITDAAMAAEFRTYQANHPEFRFIGPTYPLLHTEDAPDVLSGYFNSDTARPNLVFIIVESLSSAFSGPDPYMGSFTPFLDSLGREGLSWENCFAASERTFYVLPALFGSLPFGGGKYLDRLTRASYHQSLIRYLGNNGYTSRFFYGGDPTFNQMDLFLKRNDIGYILSYWGPGYTAQEKNVGEFSWGYPDHELFRRSFELMDSMKSGPNLDIYLTLSMHAPFIPPDEARYREMAERRADEMKFSAEQRKGLEKYLNIFSSIMYTDDALRRFFKEYATRPEYANTIFFITGDHALPELNVSWRSPWERFRVPFIIWSPMLKEKKHFRSVISHNDITPSVLAMMRNTCGIETSRMAHWIGQGIDTVQDFRCARSVVFIRNSKEMVEFIDTGYCLTEGRLARVRPDLKGEPVNNDDLLAKMKAKLDNYIRVTDYVGKQNCLIPIGMMFGHEPVGTAIPVSEPVILDKTPTTQEYMSVVKSFPIGGEILYMHCDVAFTLRSPETDPAKIPMIAFEVTGPGDTKLGWDGLPLLAPGEYRPDEPVRVVFRRNIDLSYIHEPEKCSLKLYLWNREKISFSADSLSVVLTGYR